MHCEFTDEQEQLRAVVRDFAAREIAPHAVEWDREFGRIKDVSQLAVERNLSRYRPVDVAVRATAGAEPQEVLRVALAGLRAGTAFTLSVGAGLAPAVRRALGEAGLTVLLESDAEWIERIAGAPGDARVPRVRLAGPASETGIVHRALAEAVAGDPDLAIYANAVTTAGSNCVPAPAAIVTRASSSVTAGRYGRTVVSASSVSATANTRAASGMVSPRRPSG